MLYSTHFPDSLESGFCRNFIGICSYFFDKLFSYIFPPRDILLIYGEYPVEKLGGKIATRKDKFRIKERISVDEDFETIQKNSGI